MDRHIVTIVTDRPPPLVPPSPPMFRRIEVDWQGEYHKVLPADGQKIASKSSASELLTVPEFVVCSYTASHRFPVKASAEAALPVPPRRAHGTLQPEWMKVSLWVITL